MQNITAGLMDWQDEITYEDKRREALFKLLQVASELDLTGYQLYWMLKYADYEVEFIGERECYCGDTSAEYLRIDLGDLEVRVPEYCDGMGYSNIRVVRTENDKEVKS